MSYKNASFTLAGLACLVYILNMFFWRMGVDGKSLVPGFSFMTGLVMPVLAAWLGTIIRHSTRKTNRWLSILLGLFAFVCFIRYITHPDIYTLTNQSCLSVAMIIMGYLIPEKQLESFACQDRLIPSVLIFMAAVLCYTCVAVTDGRLFNFPFPAENEDMHELIRLLLQIAEGATAVIAVYFAVILSYSTVGQSISSRRWVKIVLSVVCFLASIRILGMALTFGFPRIYSLIRIASCPLTIYIAIVAYRGLRKRSNKENMTWKEVFLIK